MHVTYADTAVRQWDTDISSMLTYIGYENVYITTLGSSMVEVPCLVNRWIERE